MKKKLLEELKVKIVTECTTWSVPHMNEQMDKLLTKAYEAGKREGLHIGVYGDGTKDGGLEENQ